MDEYGYFQKKGKGKGKKGKKGKDDDGKGGKPGDGKGKSNYVQPQTTSTPAIQNQQQQQAHYSSAASSSGHGFFAFAETEPARVDALHPRMQNKKNIDSLVVEDRTNVMQQHSITERNSRGSLFWLEILMHFDKVDKVYNDVQLMCPGKLVYKKVRLHGSHWQKARHCFHMDALQRVPSHSECFAETKESDEQQSAFSFHTVQTDLACEKGLAFHTENSAPPTVCILDLGCTRAMGSRRAVEAFCRYVDSHPNSGLWYEIQPTSSRFFFANSQQSKCTEKHVIFMYDHGWNTQFTEFDIVEEGDVPLLMSLPQMRNLGFQFELTPEKAYLSCACIGMRKMVLKTAISTHLILDLQDVAWYMSQVHFKTPQVKSFFSQHDHFEYSQIAVKQDVHEEEALVTGDYWQVDPLRGELIRHHKDKRRNLHEMNR